MSGARVVRLSDLLEAAEDFPVGLRLRAVLDVLEQLAADGGAPMVARMPASRLRLSNVVVDESGTTRVVGEGGKSGLFELVWELVAGRPLGAGEKAPPLSDVTLGVPPAVEALVGEALSSRRAPLRLEELIEAFEEASRGCVDTHDDVRRAASQALSAAAPAARATRAAAPGAWTGASSGPPRRAPRTTTESTIARAADILQAIADEPTELEDSPLARLERALPELAPGSPPARAETPRPAPPKPPPSASAPSAAHRQPPKPPPLPPRARAPVPPAPSAAPASPIDAAELDDADLGPTLVYDRQALVGEDTVADEGPPAAELAASSSSSVASAPPEPAHASPAPEEGGVTAPEDSGTAPDVDPFSRDTVVPDGRAADALAEARTRALATAGSSEGGADASGDFVGGSSEPDPEPPARPELPDEPFEDPEATVVEGRGRPDRPARRSTEPPLEPPPPPSPPEPSKSKATSATPSSGFPPGPAAGSASPTVPPARGREGSGRSWILAVLGAAAVGGALFFAARGPASPASTASGATPSSVETAPRAPKPAAVAAASAQAAEARAGSAREDGESGESASRGTEEVDAAAAEEDAGVADAEASEAEAATADAGAEPRAAASPGPVPGRWPSRPNWNAVRPSPKPAPPSKEGRRPSSGATPRDPHEGVTSPGF